VTHWVQFDIEPPMVKISHSPEDAHAGFRQRCKATTELVRRAEAGDEVVLTRRGKAVARLVQVTGMPTAIHRGAILNKVRSSGSKSAMPGPDATRSQDFLYDEDGLPR
jgi:antitoxin (DNA-binding transcriptional repressor) of toxin-antitoxin stability system